MYEQLNGDAPLPLYAWSIGCTMRIRLAFNTHVRLIYREHRLSVAIAPEEDAVSRRYSAVLAAALPNSLFERGFLTLLGLVFAAADETVLRIGDTSLFVELLLPFGEDELLAAVGTANGDVCHMFKSLLCIW